MYSIVDNSVRKQEHWGYFHQSITSVEEKNVKWNTGRSVYDNLKKNVKWSTGRSMITWRKMLSETLVDLR